MLDCLTAAAATPATSVMALGGQNPDVTQVLGFIDNDKDLKAYLSNPKTVCTFFAPTNEVSACHCVWLPHKHPYDGEGTI